ncbi:GNAT family N-acetyltransferase [Myroides odoratimimus]|uniref:GNAT family N-acetyltransferase n=1 Tax=Myroides odoratimimus TaxID=76832 RepID=UPI002DB82421|nr:GNAT family N-acetyltransferase [Myroides odoratimimus]MEC4051308.1 GNAT family N-acetyltransferase [Myroides odoratimimus]
MKNVLETDRLVLRELITADAEHFYQLNLNPNVMRYTGDDAFDSVDDAYTFLANYSDYERNGYGRWAVIRKEDNAFLGWCGLKYNADIDKTDIGFRFFEEHWNMRYATESAKACLDYGFTTLGLHYIIGRAMKENIASIKVLEKIGLVYESDFDFDGHIGVLYVITQ